MTSGDHQVTSDEARRNARQIRTIATGPEDRTLLGSGVILKDALSLEDQLTNQTGSIFRAEEWTDSVARVRPTTF